MNADLLILAARDHVIGLGPITVGVIVVAMLLTAFWYGRQRMLRQQPPPPDPQPRSGAWHTRDEYGHITPPDHGPGHQEGTPIEYESASGEHPEMPHDGHRYLPHEIAGMRSTSDEPERPGPSGRRQGGTPDTQPPGPAPSDRSSGTP